MLSYHLGTVNDFNWGLNQLFSTANLTLINIYCPMNIMLDHPFLNVHYLFTNERISVYMDKQSRMSLDIKDYLVKQNSHLSKGVAIVASASIGEDKRKRNAFTFNIPV